VGYELRTGGGGVEKRLPETSSRAYLVPICQGAFLKWHFGFTIQGE
jgi:hypothetical protein